MLKVYFSNKVQGLDLNDNVVNVESNITSVSVLLVLHGCDTVGCILEMLIFKPK